MKFVLNLRLPIYDEPKNINIPLSIFSQTYINASDVLKNAQTELRNYWKRTLDAKIDKSTGKYEKKDDRRTFSQPVM